MLRSPMGPYEVSIDTVTDYDNISGDDVKPKHRGDSLNQFCCRSM